jgi:hypothetical protein
VDSNGNLYVADSGNNRILYFPAGSTTATRVYGQATFTTSTPGTSATALKLPSGVALDGGGNLYVADNYNNRVLYFPAGSTTATVVYGQGSFTTNTPGTSATALSNPQGLALDGSGNLYVADYSNNRVVYYAAGSTTASRVYGQGGSFTTNVYGTSATSLGSPAAVALDSGGNLYVSDYSNNRLLYFPAGSTTSTLVYGQGSFTSNSPGTSATTLYEPSGLALNGGGNLYVADYANNRLLEFGAIQAVSYTLTGPQGGALNTASTNFTVTPGSGFSATISILPSGGGLSTPIVLTFNGSTAPQTFSITPTAVGPVTLTPTNNNSLTNPGALSYSTPPAAPTITSASAGNAQITVAFTANATGGSAITSYTATCGTTSISGSASPIAVTGLTNGTAYSCTVNAANAYGASAASNASNATPSTTATGSLPSAPTIVSVTPGPGSATVAFTPPASSGGSPLLGYLVTCRTGSATGISSPITVGSLFGGVSYNCSVAAVNASGTGPSSAALPVTPQSTFVPATGYVFAGPLGGPVGVPSTNFTVIPNNSYTGTITVTPSGGGLSKPVTLIWGGSKVSQPFTITPTAIGPVTLTPNSSGGLPDAAPLVYATPPAAPVMGGATWGNGSIVVSFTPGANGGSPITSYTAVCSASNSPLLTATGAGSPLVLNGIDGTPYSCVVKAANAFGASAVSAASNYATPGAPYAPQSVSAAAGNGQATISFTAPAANGTPPPTGYTVVSNPGGISVNALSSPVTVTGLANGVAYTFTVTAANGYGSGPGSVSNSVTPSASSQPLSLGSPLFPVGVQGVQYPMQILSAAGGTGPYFFTIDSGVLPAGLALSGPAFGGTPTAAGNFAFTLKVTDAAGNAAVAPASIVIEPAGADLILSDALVTLSTTVGALPAPASVTVRSSDIEQVLGYTVSSPDSWLALSGNGTAPGSISIGLSQAALGLAAGTYQSAITVACSVASACAGSTKIIAVVLNLAPPPPVAVTPSTPVVTPLGAQFSTSAGNPLGDPFGSFQVAAGTWQAAVLPGANWLSLTSQTGAVNFAVDPTAVSGNPAQIYSGTIRVTQADHDVVLDILPAGTPAKPVLSAAGLVFTPGSGPQQVAVYAGSSYPLDYQATASAPWLSVNPAMGRTLAGAPGQSVVSVNPAGLAPGVYRGNVNYALASDAVRTVSVTLLVQGSTCDPTQLIATQTGLPHNFQTVAGLPVDLALNVVNGCGAPVTSAQVSASFSNGDQPVQLSPVDSTSGTFAGTWIPGAVASQVAVTGIAVVQGASPATAAIAGKVTPY